MRRLTMKEHQEWQKRNCSKCYGCEKPIDTSYSKGYGYTRLVPRDGATEVYLCRGRGRGDAKEACFILARERQPMCPACGEPYPDGERWSPYQPCCSTCVTNLARVKSLDAAEAKAKKDRGVGKTEWYRVKPASFFPYLPGDEAESKAIDAVKALLSAVAVGPVASDPQVAGGWVPNERWIPANGRNDAWDRNVELYAQLNEKQAEQLTAFAHRLEAVVMAEFTRGQQDGMKFIVGLAEGTHTIGELEAAEVRLAGRQKRAAEAIETGEKMKDSLDDHGHFGR